MWRVVNPPQTGRAILSVVSDPRQVVLIMLGAGINFSVGFGLFASGLSALIVSRGGVLLATGLPGEVLILATSYFVIGSVYSTVASLALNPKRIVNPLFIQLVTASFVPVLVFYILGSLPSINFLEASFV